MLVRLAVLALLVSADAPAPPPCRAASAPLPPAAGVSKNDRAEVERYRASWRRACDPKAPAADLGSLLGDAEALVADVSSSRTIEAIAQAHEAKQGAPWPLPGIVRDEDGKLEVDWASFGAAAERGTAEDRRFWRGAVLAADHTGEPSWLGDPAPSGAPCVRLGQADWPALADALDAMERAGSEPYVRHARALRTTLVDTFTRLARGPEACACLPTKDAAAGLEPLAATGAERVGTPARRALAKASSDALQALKGGRVRVRFLRQAPDAPATGCGTAK